MVLTVEEVAELGVSIGQMRGASLSSDRLWPRRDSRIARRFGGLSHTCYKTPMVLAQKLRAHTMKPRPQKARLTCYSPNRLLFALLWYRGGRKLNPQG